MVEDEQQEDEDVRASDEINDVLMMLMPWGISFLLHLGLVLLAIFIVWSVQVAVPEEEVIIPNANLSATPGAPLTQRTTKKTKMTRSSRRSLTKSRSQSQSTLSTKANTQSTLIGAAGASGAQASAFGDSVRDAGGFRASFFGTGGNAKKIVYLIDASGSLIDTLPFVILELKRSIGQLVDKQSFTVIFFQSGEPVEVPPPGLKDATQENKQKIFQWVDETSGMIIPMGKANPVTAIERSLRYRPHLLFILSDEITGSGQYEVDQRRLLTAVEEANQYDTKINTIQFLYQDPLVEYGLEPTMKLIADDAAGEYKYLNDKELGIR